MGRKHGDMDRRVTYLLDLGRRDGVLTKHSQRPVVLFWLDIGRRSGILDGHG